MKRFTALYMAMDQTNRTSQKLALMKQYFRDAPPADAAWGLYFLSGDRLKRLLPSKLLRAWALEEAKIPEWLADECYSAVGDSAETLALLLPRTTEESDLPLHVLIEERLKPLAALPDDERRLLVLQTWRELSADQKLVWNKIITGEFRVGVSRTLVVRALAEVAGHPPGEIAHRLMGDWTPSAENYTQLISAEAGTASAAKPYPFFLAYPIEGKPGDLGMPAEWQAEWKWDGIRGQVIRRGPEPVVRDPQSDLDRPQTTGHGSQTTTAIWSRGEDLVTDRFPEIRNAASLLPLGTVLDGEILAWKDSHVMPFAELQRRLGRKTVGAKLQQDVPVAFMVYDLLEENGEDLRTKPLSERRLRLEALLAKLPPNPVFQVSPTLRFERWEELNDAFARSRGERVEGIMLKRQSAPYRVGRVKGDWWKWKIDPYHIDAVMMYAQHGHGRRASLYTDYTFGLWHEGKLVPVAKAYSGLTDEEIRQVDAWVRRNSTERFGPVRVVKQELVFELAFEGIQLSTRHKSGVAVRFPRMSRWRHDKPASEADTLERLKALAAIGQERPVGGDVKS